MREYTIGITSPPGLPVDDATMEVVDEALQNSAIALGAALSANMRDGTYHSTFQVEAESGEEAFRLGVRALTEALLAAGIEIVDEPAHTSVHLEPVPA